MKHLKIFEKFSKKENKTSLTLKLNEKNEWDPFGEEIDNTEKNELIKYIGNTVDKYQRKGRMITMSDMEADFSPVVYSDDQETHQIESIYNDMVEVFIYEDEPSNKCYFLRYHDLKVDTLKEIKEILDNAIKYDLIEEI